MHKFILNIFSILKNSVNFLQILSIFCLLCLLLHWIEHLTSASWSFLNFIKPVLYAFIDFANNFTNDRSLSLFNAVFEYKYALASILFIGLYYVFNIIIFLINFLEEKYVDIRSFIKKQEENALNKSLENDQNKEARKFKKYRVYISTQLKKGNIYNTGNVNLEEQNKILNKFLIEKTSILPEVYKDGYLYNFNDFYNIDEKIDLLFTLINSKAPIDYQICIQIISSEKNKEIEQRELDEIISLKILNKIVFFANLAWRYDFNSTKKYETEQAGLYQNNNNTYEVHEFINKGV